MSIIMTTICKPLKAHVVRNGYCVNCGGKGGTPGPCKTSFDEVGTGTEIGGEAPPTAPTPTAPTPTAPGSGPEKYLSPGDVKNIKRLVKETAKSVKLPENLKDMTPEQVQGEMDKLYTPLAMKKLSNDEMMGTLSRWEKYKQRADQTNDPGMKEQYEVAIKNDLDRVLSKQGGVFGSSFDREYDTGNLVKGVGPGAYRKLYQSPLIGAYANEVKASAPMKKLQAAKIKAEQNIAKAAAKPTKKPRS